MEGGPYYTLVDDDDFVWLSKFNWILSDTGYAIHCTRADGKTLKLRLNRFVMGVTNSKDIVDHINGDKLDNRKSNLRVVSHSLNRHNTLTDINKVKIGLFRGVHYRSDRKKYEASFTHNGVKKLIGRYDDIIDAALAYDKACIAAYKDDAITNFKIVEEIYFKMKNKV